MKRAMALLLALMLLVLCACQSRDDTESASQSDAVTTDSAEDTLPDLPEDDGFDDISFDDPMDDAVDDAEAQDPSDAEQDASTQASAPKNYTYLNGEQIDLAITYKYPGHWVDISTDLSVIYEEPAEEGIQPARMAITRKLAGDIVVTEEVGMDKLSAFAQSLKSNCTGFKSKRGKRFKFSGNVGFQFSYVGNFNGVATKGHAALTYVKKKNAFYLFHFSAPTERFASFDNVRRTILKSIRV